MNAHTFVCYEENTVPNQYTGTMNQLSKYTYHTYTYGEDVHLIVHSLEHTTILKPESLKEEKSNDTDKKWNIYFTL